MTSPAATLGLLAGAGFDNEHFAAARAHLARAEALTAGFEARTAELRAGLVEDLASGRVDVEQAAGRAAELVVRHATLHPEVLCMAGSGVLELARAECQRRAAAEVKLGGPAVDEETRDRIAGCDDQISKLLGQLPEDMRGDSLPSSAGRKLVGIWSDLIDARRRREDLVRLRQDLRAAGVVEPTPGERAAEERAEAWRVAAVSGQVKYSMSGETADALKRSVDAPGYDRIISAGASR